MRHTVFSTSHWLLVAGVILFGVRGAAADVISLADLTLASESYWNGPDPAGTEVPGDFGTTVRVGSFTSGNVEFVNRYNLDWFSWDGFAYSNTTDTTTADYTNHSAYTGSGLGDANYGVAYGYVDALDPSDVGQLQQLPYFELPAGAGIQSAYVTNTTYAALLMRDGDPNFFSKKFGGTSGNDPDWFKLSVYGTDAAGTPLAGSVDLDLADYTSADNDLDYIVDEWTFMDLSPLADARRVYFNLTSSDTGSWGMNTPAYFAIDNIEFVPEPSTLAIFTGGGFVIGALSLRRRRRSSRGKAHRPKECAT